MTNRQGIGLGLLCGVALGVVACVAVLIWTGERMQEAQAEAYEAGLDTGIQRMRGEGNAIRIAMNEGLLQSNEDMSAQIDEAIKFLEPLASRNDLPEEAKVGIQAALGALDK